MSRPGPVRPLWRTFLQATLVASLAAQATGCELVGFVGQVFTSDRVPAAHTLRDVPTAVFVEDGEARLPSVTVTAELAAAVGQHLVENGAVESVLPAKQVVSLTLDRMDDQWSAARIGREVGAEQVIHIRIDRYDTSGSGPVHRPEARVHVRVVEAASGRQRFPAKGRDHPVTTRMFYREQSEKSSETSLVVGRKLARRSAGEVAELFYDHHPRRPGDGFPE